MAICAALDAAGVVIQQASIPLNQCTGFVLLDKADWTQYGLIQGLITIPAGSEFAAAWMAGFAVPMVAGLAAHCVQQIISIWNH